MEEDQVVVLESSELNGQGVAEFAGEIRAGREFEFSPEADRILTYRFVAEGNYATRFRPNMWKELSRHDLATALERLYDEVITDGRWPNWKHNSLADRMSRIEVSLSPQNKGNTDKYVNMIWMAYGSGDEEDSEQAGVNSLRAALRRHAHEGNQNEYVARHIGQRHPQTIDEFCWVLYQVLHEYEIACRANFGRAPVRHPPLALADKKCDGCGNLSHIRRFCPLSQHAEFNTELGVPFRLSYHGRQRDGAPIPLPDGYVNPHG